MQKFCIFCGNNPVGKNKEHIIPQWLIKMTGDTNRSTLIGFNNGKEIRFSWMNYVFPSCEICNSEFAKIEAQVKNIVIKLIEEQSINHTEINLFLDWLDKIRVGIWLGQAQLYKKDISPNFYINQRVGDKDRFCLMYKSDDNDKGIGIIGTETDIFEIMPSCFGLTINNLHIVNYSKEFILSENLGFPYPDKFYYLSNGTIRVDTIKSGKYKIALPILEGKILKPAIKFYQSIIKSNHGLKKPIIGRGKKYLAENAFIFNSDLIQSRIIVSDEFKTTLSFWKKNDKITFAFLKKFPRTILSFMIAKIIIEHQRISVNEVFNHLEEYGEEKESIIQFYTDIIASTDKIIAELNEDLNPLIKMI